MPTFSHPQAYEAWMGRWSKRLAPLFVTFANVNKPGRYLDVGSGTGVLARCIVEDVQGSEVIGIEPSVSYVEHAVREVSNPRATFQVGDAQAMPFENDEFDAALALLVIQEIPDAKKAIGEMCRVTRSGGWVAATQWDFVSGMPSLAYFWEAVSEVLPTEEVRKEAKKRRPPGYSDAGALTDLWAGLDLESVETAELEIKMEFAMFEDYWTPFLGGATPTSSYAATLSEKIRDALVSHLRGRILANGPDRPFSLPARALAVRGQVQ